MLATAHAVFERCCGLKVPERAATQFTIWLNPGSSVTLCPSGVFAIRCTAVTKLTVSNSCARSAQRSKISRALLFAVMSRLSWAFDESSPGCRGGRKTRSRDTVVA